MDDMSKKIYLVKTKIEFILNDITKAKTALKAVLALLLQYIC